MGASKQKDNSVFQILAATRASHAKRLQKVEQALAKFDKQRLKLSALEAELAVLARRCAVTTPPTDDQPSHSADKLERVYVIVNPASKGLTDGTVHLETIVAELRAVGILAEIGLKSSGKVARLMARAAVERGDRLLIVAAGDGTIEDVARELVGSQTTLGILPLGTMNNLARAWGVPLDLHAACLLLAMGTTRRLDIGSVVTPAHAHKTYFLELAGVGLSALGLPMGQAVEKGRWATLLGTLDNYLTYKAAHVIVVCDDGQTLQADTHLVTLSNSPLFGNHMLSAPKAKMDDGLLDVALYDGMNKIDLQSYFLNSSNGKRVDDPRVHFYRARKVRISADRMLAANADMRVMPEQQSWEFALLPKALMVIVGNGMAVTLPVESAPAPPPLSGPFIAPENGVK